MTKSLGACLPPTFAPMMDFLPWAEYSREWLHALELHLEEGLTSGRSVSPEEASMDTAAPQVPSGCSHQTKSLFEVLFC